MVKRDVNSTSIKAAGKHAAAPDPGGIVEQKEELRQRIREKRYVMALDEYRRTSEKIELGVIKTPEFAAAREVCCYVHKESTREPATDAILRAVLADPGKELVVPITRVKEGRIDLSIVDDLADLRPSTFGVPEPVHEYIIDPSTVNLVIVPCLAVDRRGFRLGYGKAFYDKLLSAIPAGVPAIAMAFEFQVFPEIPVAPHDKPVSAIVTEKRVIRC
ncbi:MAG: 5-formyltetrahydrofolate cyclo-ligase [Candidatus Lokiarchaeota archaeon]|nr:5-formyltetrahydrofolate cyclo-ligase [Candidatus Lokiarchaeota archaeon]